MLIKGTNQEQTSFQRTRAAPTINNQLPGTFWVNHLPSVLKHSMIALHNIPSDQMTDMTEAFERMQRFFFFFFPGDPRHHPSHSDCAPDSVIYSKRPLVDGTVLVAKLSDLTPSCERGSLKKNKTKNKIVLQLQSRYCMHGRGKIFYNRIWKCFHLVQRTQLLIIFHVSVGEVFIGTLQFDSRREVKMVRPNPILDHWCMQSFPKKS